MSKDNRKHSSKIVDGVEQAPSRAMLRAVGFKNEIDDTEHKALIKGEPESLKEPVLVRMHSECLTGDAFGSLRCDCRPQLEAALARIEQEGEGVVVYLTQEGRGIGLANKIKAYDLQFKGLDTYDADIKMGFLGEERDFTIAVKILNYLKIKIGNFKRRS